MARPQPPQAVKPISGILVSSLDLFAAVHAVLAEELRPIEDATVPHPWKRSVYYAREMGEAIWRQYVAFEGVMDPGDLAAWKLCTNEIEQRWRHSTGRQVNIDPGYLSLTQLVLASAKPVAHRVYIGSGIYAEATLYFAHGRFRPWPYAYEDYASDDACEFFTRVRERLRRSARRADRGAGSTKQSDVRSRR